jgi:hypothetical protein
MSHNTSFRRCFSTFEMKGYRLRDETMILLSCKHVGMHVQCVLPQQSKQGMMKDVNTIYQKWKVDLD